MAGRGGASVGWPIGRALPHCRSSTCLPLRLPCYAPAQCSAAPPRPTPPRTGLLLLLHARGAETSTQLTDGRAGTELHCILDAVSCSIHWQFRRKPYLGLFKYMFNLHRW